MNKLLQVENELYTNIITQVEKLGYAHEHLQSTQVPSVGLYIKDGNVSERTFSKSNKVVEFKLNVAPELSKSYVSCCFKTASTDMQKHVPMLERVIKEESGKLGFDFK